MKWWVGHVTRSCKGPLDHKLQDVQGKVKKPDKRWEIVWAEITKSFGRLTINIVLGISGNIGLFCTFFGMLSDCKVNNKTRVD